VAACWHCPHRLADCVWLAFAVMAAVCMLSGSPSGSEGKRVCGTFCVTKDSIGFKNNLCKPSSYFVS